MKNQSQIVSFKKGPNFDGLMHNFNDFVSFIVLAHATYLHVGNILYLHVDSICFNYTKDCSSYMSGYFSC